MTRARPAHSSRMHESSEPTSAMGRKGTQASMREADTARQCALRKRTRSPRSPWRPYHRRSEAPAVAPPTRPPHALAELQHPGRAIPSSGGDQARDRLLDAPGQGEAAALASDGDQRLGITEVADQRHALGVGLGRQL
jgi:hypothetical protein